MDRMAFAQDLLNAWTKAVEDGKVVNEFEVPNGEKIQFGLKIQNGCLQYYAKDIETGREIPALVEEKKIDRSDFVIQFNGYRALKPGGKIPHIGRQPDIPGEAINCRFYCQEPSHRLSILNRDPLMQIVLPNYKWNAYYNATPFEKEGHFLWLPTIPHIQQELSRVFLEDALTLFRRSDKLIVFFNSLHAGASVNHIHLQAIFHKQTLSIENAPVIKKDGLNVFDGYPANGIVFDRDTKSGEIWSLVDFFQKENIPFNLIFIGKRICLIPRDPSYEVAAEFPMIVIASLELAGKIITFDRNAYDNISYAMIQKAFQKTTALYF